MDPRIEMAVLLIQLGLTTVSKVRELFSQDDSMDDAKLDAIMADVDRRIARRS